MLILLSIVHYFYPNAPLTSFKGNTMNKKSLNENQTQQAPDATNLSASAKKLEGRLAKIPGLDQLMQTVTKRDDAAEILAGMAEKLGGDKVAGSKALTAALAIAKEEEKEQAAAPPAQAQQEVVSEASRRVNKFVSYLFE